MSKIKNNEFRDYLKEKFRIELSYTKTKKEINKILPGDDLLKAESFFKALKELETDIDKECHTLFAKSKNWTKYESEHVDNNRFKTFIGKYTNIQEQIGRAAGIKKTRFNRVMNGTLDAYPYEIYDLAMCLDLKPSELFEYFYGNGSLEIKFLLE